MFLLLQTGMLGVFISLDFFLFYVFWETGAGADVLHHRRLGRPAEALRGHQVLPLHAGRLAC